MGIKLDVRRRQLVTLDVGDEQCDDPEQHVEISCVAQSGRNLWIGSDETISAERLTWDSKRKAFRGCARYPMSDFFQLPAGPKEEIDLEGMAFAPPFLWITGSHSLTRGKAQGRSFDEAIADLTEIERQTNRYFLARIPLIECTKSPEDFELVGAAVDPRTPRRKITATRLFGTGATSVLTDALRFDELLSTYVQIPSKDNGLDVEGLAIAEDRVLLGLRGPVLRGWAVVLELEPVYFSSDYFTLGDIGKQGKLYRRHFFDLRGLGIRDLQVFGDDLLILAGPTMAIDGRVLLMRWKGFRRRKKESVVSRDDLQVVLDFWNEDIGDRGTNHPEGITVFAPPSDCDLPPGILVTYDSPAGKYRPGKARVAADLFPFRD